MTALAIAVVCLMVGVGGAYLVLERPPCLRRRVIVNFRHDQSSAYSGVLWQARGRWIVLKDVQALRSDGKVSIVDGDQVFERSAVLYMQVPPGERV